MLFRFFNKDHKFLLELIGINEYETIYTAAFNPVYNVRFSDPNTIKKIAEKFLTEDELKKISGIDQKGKIVFGIAWHKFRDNWTREHEEFSLIEENVTEEYLLNFYDSYKDNLTENEKRQLLLYLIGNPSVLIQLRGFNLSNYAKLWENNITRDDAYSALSTALISFSDYTYVPQKLSKFYGIIDFLLNKTESLMFDPEKILEIYINQKILHRAASHQTIFRKFWEFLVHNSEKQDQIDLLQKNDFYGHMWFRYEGKIDNYFDTIPFKILHFSMMYNMDNVFKFVSGIYDQYLKRRTMRDIILESNWFLIYIVRTADRETCEQVTKYLERLFAEHKKDLLEFLMNKIGTTDYTIFEYFKRFEEKYADKIKVFKNLKERLEQQDNTGSLAY